jgi:crotonobetainyl-CoA:carnitine CoA-transferase CaiB-like acyl-CoA transferase
MALAMASLPVIGELLDLPELARYDDERSAYDHRDEVKERIQRRVVERPTAAWLEVLATRDVWCAPVQTFDDVVADPQVEHNRLLTTVPHPNGGGDVRVVGVPMRFSATPGTIRSGPPAVGQHTDEVLRELGFDDEDVRSMRAEGVV